MTTVIGIDPGASGGFAWNSQGEGVQACPMPRDEDAVVELLRRILLENKDHRVVAYMELVTGYVRKAARGEACHACGGLKQDGGEPGSRMFSFGRGVGVITGALKIAMVDILEVSPRTWQKPYVNSLTGQDGKRYAKPERKRILRDIAQRRFQQIEVTLKTADALLIYAHASALVEQELEGLEPEGRPIVPPIVSVPELKQRVSKLKQEIAAVPVDGTDFKERSCVRQPGEFRIGVWKGQPYVFAPDIGGAYRMIRKASEGDIQRFPKLAA
jgi:hypothetical protein